MRRAAEGSAASMGARTSALMTALALGVTLTAAAGVGRAEEPAASASVAATRSGDAPPTPASPEGLGRRFERPPFDAILAREAGRLGLDDATLARIRAVADDARPETEALESELRDERHALRALLQTDTPDGDAVLRQVERAGAAATALEKQRISTMLEIRKLLTPAQRAELVRIFRERKQERGRWWRDPSGAPPAR